MENTALIGISRIERVMISAGNFTLVQIFVARSEEKYLQNYVPFSDQQNAASIRSSYFLQHNTRQ